MDPEHIEKIVRNHAEELGAVISILEEIQSKYSFLPEQALRIVAQKTGRSLVDIYGVATFYKLFTLKPRGKHLVSVCLGTACHVRGAQSVVEEFERQLQINTSETTSDGEVTLETVNCLGACALGPIVLVDGHYFSNVTPKKVTEILRQAKAGVDIIDVTTDERVFPITVNCPRCNHSLMDQAYPIDGYPSVRVTSSSERGHGWLRLSCLFGSFSTESQRKVPRDTVVNFFCPHCHEELISSSMCDMCDASMVPMLVSGGGLVQICPRKGCRGHMLDLSGVNA